MPHRQGQAVEGREPAALHRATGSDAVAAWSFDEGGAAAQVSDLVTGTNDPVTTVVREQQGGPWVADHHGRALALDGYSTWVARPARNFTGPHGSMAIIAWFAPLAFGASRDDVVAAIVSQLDTHRSRGFELGIVRSGQVVFRIGDGTQLAEVRSSEALALSRWSCITASHDVITGTSTVSVDGVVARQHGDFGVGVLPAQRDLLLGRASEPVPVDSSFVEGAACGLLGALEIRRTADRRAISPEPRLPAIDLPPVEQRFRSDQHRPRFHLMPPRHWMNEPHAAIEFEGRHHVFFQHNPRGPFFGSLHWGHAISDDLAHWTILAPALSPHTTGVAPDGVWSGSSTIGPDGLPWLVFTAGDEGRTPNQAVAIARALPRSIPLETLRFEPLGIVNELDRGVTTPQGPLLPTEFRDPFVWRDGDVWWQLVGAGVVGVGGTTLLYRSTDLEKWDYLGPLMVGDVARFPRTGEMWELPVLLPVGRGVDGELRHALFVAPWWSGPSEHHLTYVWYWIGRFDPATGAWTVDDEVPRHFDVGGYLTGPSGTVLTDGRAVLWTIAQDGRSPAAQHASGWAHNAGLPLHVWLGEKGELCIEPLPELAALRQREIAALAKRSFDDLSSAGWAPDEPMAELELTAWLATGATLTVTIGDRTERTDLSIDRDAAEIVIDRTASSSAPLAAVDRRCGPINLDRGELRLKVYLDHSMIEAYVNETTSVTTRVYRSDPDPPAVRVTSTGTGVIRSLRMWELSAAVTGNPPAATLATDTTETPTTDEDHTCCS